MSSRASSSGSLEANGLQRGERSSSPAPSCTQALQALHDARDLAARDVKGRGGAVKRAMPPETLASTASGLPRGLAVLAGAAEGAGRVVLARLVVVDGEGQSLGLPHGEE
eukprot:jgi/Tetstr1/430659/TSEL_020452.t1